MTHRNFSSAKRRLLAIGTVGVVGAALLASGQQGGAATGAQTLPAKGCHPADDAGVVADWNSTAVGTLITDAVRSPAESYVYFGFTHAAMHNAVNGITREYRLYKWGKRGPRCASPEAAAASAAYHLLSEYFSTVPAAKTRLDAAYAASLEGISDGWAEDAGVRYGKRAAQRIVNIRANDRRYAPLAFTMPPGPGIWRPTSDPPVPFSTPWLSQMKPMVMKHSDRFRPGPPPALTSAKYARQYNEVKELGAMTGSTRSLRADEDGAVLLRHRRRRAAGRSPRPRRSSRHGHQRQRAPICRRERRRLRRFRRLVGREVPLRILAAGHGDPIGRH